MTKDKYKGDVDWNSWQDDFTFSKRGSFKDVIFWDEKIWILHLWQNIDKATIMIYPSHYHGIEFYRGPPLTRSSSNRDFYLKHIILRGSFY